MKSYEVSVKVSGFVFRAVKAETRSEAEREALSKAWNSNWNELAAAEIKVVESEELKTDG